MSQAKSKEHYTSAWKSHIGQLYSVGYPLSKVDPALYEELQSTIDRLKELVDIAAEHEFPETEAEQDTPE